VTTVSLSIGEGVLVESMGESDYSNNLTALIEAGVLRVSDALVPGGVGRRSLLIGGSAGAAIALAGLSLPAAAASSSPVDEPADDTLIGEWVIEGGPLYFRLSRATYPFLPAVEFVELTDSGTVYNYSRLTIGGQSVPIYSFVSQGLVEWSTDPLDFPGLSGDITGTFSVDNKSYTVTFQPGQPVPV